MKVCKNCGKNLEDNILFCSRCGSDAFKKKSNKTSIMLVIGIIIAVCVILGKDTVKYNYYVMKGNNETSVSQSIDYYKKALRIDYKQELVDKIGDKIKEDDNFKLTLDSLEPIIKKEDIDKIYLNIYVSKAKKNFENKNYETTWDYLLNAQDYGYNVEDFEYYKDLVKADEQEESYEVDSEIYNVDYIIDDSNTRYLTINELSAYSKEELGYIRNEIFARYGYIFNTKKYRDYFEAKHWYIPNPYFSGNESDLNVVERANIQLIKSLED